ncbi:MFS transporter [Actinomadura opuntiae]|uniref:MFS transporter n=1 Tax=Actinomadura sp. OS1-43 TaxID=604315 RepID=UPI00255AFC35|nr:MFS transporter [Actinomadura sp. OS1-43]MDL4816096.1 MFS transporter [Actinomadura sp. OS1-43]
MNQTLNGRAVRARPMAALCTGTALMNAAMAMASVAGTLAAADRLGAGWGGVPATAGIVGTGAGALALTRAARRLGRRRVLAGGYLAAAAGACLAAAGIARGDLVALCAGMLMLGLGNAGAQLSRYAAADLYPPGRRGSAIGLVVWAAAIGAVGGPLLLDASGGPARDLSLPPLAGPFLLAFLATAAAAVAATATAGAPPVTDPPRDGPRVSVRSLLRGPVTRPALVVMVTAQVVMVAVMTAAPLAMRMDGDGLGMVGMTLSAHTLGMFALSPVTGRLVDRCGARPVMVAGVAALAVSAGLAAAGGGAWIRTSALFLLGYAWNLCFVGGSGQLASELPESERTDIEGTVDAAVWTIAAAAGLLSTVLMSAAGYGVLAGTFCCLAVAAGAALRRPARASRAARAAGQGFGTASRAPSMRPRTSRGWK